MPSYILGLIAAFVEPVAHAWSNIIDSNFSNHVFPRLSVLILLGMLFNLVFLPVILWISPAHTVPFYLLVCIFIISLIEVLYLFPYYWSLKSSDTSVVASLFSLGEVAVPMLAYFYLGERLDAHQYMGFGLVIFSAIGLTLNLRKLRLNSTFFLMLGASLILAVEAVLYKYVFIQGVSWGSAMLWGTLFQILIILPLALACGLRAIRDGFIKAWTAGPLFLTNEVLGSLGNLSGSYALSVLPASIMKAIGSTQPAFVLTYAYLFGKAHPTFFKEAIDMRSGAKKAFFFLLTIVGVVLVLS